MTPLDPALLDILQDSMLLQERMEAGPVGDASPDQALSARRRARWRERLGGDPDAVGRRIASAGWCHARVEAVLSGGGGRTAIPRPLPEWLLLLRRVLSVAPAPDVAANLGSLPFGALLDGFVTVARHGLAERLSPAGKAVAGDAVLRSLELALAGSISEVTARCLLADLDAERPAGSRLVGLLAGEAGGDRVHSAFVERQRTDRLRGFFLRYPMAARLAATRTIMWIGSSAELLERLARDLPEIRRRLPGADRGGAADVVSLDVRLADRHDHGRSVAIVTFADGGMAVYKPRPLAPEAAWQAFVSAVDPAFGPLAAAVLDRGAYGWMEYVAPRDLPGRGAAGAFYRSAGALICLARALALDDLHFENVVAAGERPVPIDLETIAGPRAGAPPPRTAPERIARAREAVLADSARDTGALPARHSVSTLPPRDISAFADLGAASRRRAVWHGVGTDAIVRRFADAPFTASNLPRHRGAVVPPDAYGEEIAEGFAAAWDALARAAGRLDGADGFVDRLAGVPVRFVHRATEIYGRLLEAALEPAAMRSGIDFSIELEALHRAAIVGGLPEASGPLVEAERRALSRGDIPRFSTAAGGTEIRADEAPVDGAAAAHSGLETVRRRLAGLTAGRRAVELRLVRLSFAAARRQKGQPPDHRLALDGRPPLRADEALAAAIGIGRTLLDGLILRTDGGAAWIGLVDRAGAGGPAAVLLDESLATGTTGIGVFLAALHRVTGEAAWRAGALEALVDAARIAREGTDGEPVGRRPSSGFDGVDGLASALALAAEILGEETLRADAGRLASMIDPRGIPEAAGAGGAIGAPPARAARLLTGAGAAESAVAALLADGRSLDGVGDGLFGGVEALLVAGRHGRPDLTDRAAALAGAVLERACRAGGFRLIDGLPPTHDALGFLGGTSGIGYTLLRIARPEVLPSVLLAGRRA